MTEAPAFAGLVVAGGEGRRWGGPKAWARLPDGRTFLEACASTLRAAGAACVVATLPPQTVEIEAPSGVLPVVLPRRGLDMFASVRLGLVRLLDELPWRAVLLQPVDHPLVRQGTIRRLVTAGPPAAIPRFEGRHGHPVCLWREVAEGIVGGRLQGPTLREVLAAVRPHEVVVEDAGVRANCNTPESLERALQAATSRRDRSRGA